MRFHRRYAEWIVGLFTVVALAILVGALVLLGVRHGWFESRLVFYGRLKEPSGLTPGAVVQVGGLPAGRVTDIRLDQQQGIVIEMRVSQNYRNFIRADSTASVQATTLVGSPAVNIRVGSTGRPPLEEGSFIATDTSASLLGMADLTRLLRSAANLTERMADPKGALWKALDRLDRITTWLDEQDLDWPAIVRELQETSRLGVRLLARMDKLLDEKTGVPIYVSDRTTMRFAKDTVIAAEVGPRMEKRLDRLMATLDRLDGLMARVQDPDTDLGAMLEGKEFYEALVSLLRDTRGLVGATSRVMTDLSKVTPDLPELLEQAFHEMREVDKLLRALRDNPLLRGGFKEPEPLEPTNLEGTGDSYTPTPNKD